MDEALKQRCAADNLDLFRKIAGHLKIISAHFHNQQMESKVTFITFHEIFLFFPDNRRMAVDVFSY